VTLRRGTSRARARGGARPPADSLPALLRSGKTAPLLAACCHTNVVYTALAAAKTPETFYPDYYVAIVTILPVLMVATYILRDFAEHLSSETQQRWPALFYLLVSILYLYSPIIAATGTVAGVLALMFQDTNGWYQWITFACFICVIVFLAIASAVYILASDPTKGARKVWQRPIFKWW